MPIEYSDQFHFDPSELRFDAPDIARRLESLSLTDLGLLRFGVIGFNERFITTRYNLREADPAGRPSKQVLGHSIDEALMPILNASQIIRHLAKIISEERHHDWTFRCDLLYPVGAQLRIRMVYHSSIPTRYLLIEQPIGDGRD